MSIVGSSAPGYGSGFASGRLLLNHQFATVTGYHDGLLGAGVNPHLDFHHLSTCLFFLRVGRLGVSAINPCIGKVGVLIPPFSTLSTPTPLPRSSVPAHYSHASIMPARINGWHRGERLIHDRMKFTDPVVDTLHKYIEAELPEDHREFHSTRVQFFPISVLDELGRPWVSILAGPGGGPGFVSSPSNITLSLKARSWDGDPFLENVRPPGSRRKTLVAGIGLDYSTRKRTKFAGHVSRLEQNGMDLNLEFTITQAIQYVSINVI